MSRILFWIILFGAAYWFWRRAKNALAQAQAAANGGVPPGATARTGARGTRGAGGGAPQLAEPMVRCAYCGAHSPSSEAISLYRLHFCNAEHARRYAEGERATDHSDHS